MSILLIYLLLHERAAPIDVFRHAIHLEYNIDISIFLLYLLTFLFCLLTYFCTQERH